ncbi:hypothetical protein JCGZ_15281 [Jatropha curcas]|uniref:Uncharacterized protein n=1 Tax=Jatropha curcas TaxID=180498 RepID=A0A067K9J2_JATCU|nr:hypothetical protein JCGZ_15281 [Jatropha curcas]
MAAPYRLARLLVIGPIGSTNGSPSSFTMPPCDPVTSDDGSVSVEVHDEPRQEAKIRLQVFEMFQPGELVHGGDLPQVVRHGLDEGRNLVSESHKKRGAYSSDRVVSNAGSEKDAEENL